MKSFKKVTALILVTLLMVGMLPMQAFAAEANTLKTGTNFQKALGTDREKVVTMAFHAKTTVPAGATIDVSLNGDIKAAYSNGGKNLDIYSNGPIYANADSSTLFEAMKSLESVDLTGLDTSKVTCMGGMFWNCSSLKTLDLSGFNTAAVTDFSYMFTECTALTSVNLSSFNTKKAEDFGLMFLNCSKLTSLDLSSFTVHEHSYYNSTFNPWDGLKGMLQFAKSGTDYACSCLILGSGFKATGEDVGLPAAKNSSSKWLKDDKEVALSAVTGPGTYLWEESALPPSQQTYALYDGPLFNSTLEKQAGKLANVKSITFHPLTKAPSAGFSLNNDGSVVGIYTSATGAVDVYCEGKISLNPNADSMFAQMTGLTSLDLTPLTSTVMEHVKSMFATCTGLASVKFGKMDTSKVPSFEAVFAGCSKLKSVDLTGLSAASATSMAQMFLGCSTLSGVTLGTSLNTSRVKDFSLMFMDCTSLKTLSVSGLNTAAATTLSGMFYGCSKLGSLDLSTFKTSNVTDMSGMFYGCSSLNTLKMTNWNTGKVADMTQMFYGCSSLTELGMDSFNLSLVTKANATDMLNLKGKAESYACSKVTLGSGMTFTAGDAGLPAADNENSGKWYSNGTWYSVSSMNSAGSYYWEQNDLLTVTFNAGSDANWPEAVTVSKGGLIQSPAAPQRKGYTFGGWYTNEDYTTKWDFNTNTVTADTTLYALWTIKSYTIKFSGNGSTSGSMSQIQATYNESVTLTANTYKKTGYTFIGWNTKKDGTGIAFSDEATVKNLKDTGTIYLYAQWKVNTYTIKFYGNNSTSGSMSSVKVTYDTEATLPANTFKRTGYKFNGWNTKKDGSGTSYENEAIVKNLKGSGTFYLYAQWKANTYTISFNGNGKTSGTMKAVKATYGKSKTLTANAYKKKGYTFSGWNTKKDGSGTSYKDKASVKNLKASGTCYLYAQWKANKYTIKFNGNGSTSGSMKSITATYDRSKTLTANAYKKSGYKFVGWNTKKDGSGTTYKDKASVKNLKTTGTITLYAKWKKK